MRSFIFVTLAASLVATPAIAAPDAPHFRQCDGFKKPNKKGDGMNSGSFLFGLAKSREDIRRSKTRVEPKDGVEACKKALADPLLKPEFAERRASLTQSLAYHQMGLFAYDEAMATLDAVDAIDTGADPILHSRGIGLGNQLLRGFSLIQEERHGEAMEMLAQIDAARPYSVTNRRITDKLRLLIDDRLDNQIEILKRRAPLDPGANALGFILSLEFSRFEDALQFGSGMVFELPKSRGGWTITGEASLNYELISIRAEFAGGLAYALAASGDEAGATAKLLEARQQVEIAMAPPPPRKNGKPQKKRVVRDFNMRKLYGRKGERALDLWADLIQLRKDMPDLDLDQFDERLKALPDRPGPIIIDLISLAGGVELGTRAELVSNLLKVAHERRTKRFEVTVFDLLDLLPHPEAPENQVKLKKGGNFWSENGFALKKMDSEDDFTVRFTDLTATAGTVEEFSIAAAAQEAVKRGYDRMLLQSSRTVQRTTRIYGAYGGSYGSQNSGREAQLRVRFVKSDAVPAELQGSIWRMLDTSKIAAELANLPQRQPKKRKRRR